MADGPDQDFAEPEFPWPTIAGGIITALAIVGNIALAIGVWLDDRPWTAAVSHGLLMGLLQVTAAACAFGLLDRRHCGVRDDFLKLLFVSLAGGGLWWWLTDSEILFDWICCVVVLGLLYWWGAGLPARGTLRISLGVIAWLGVLAATSVVWFNAARFAEVAWKIRRQEVAQQTAARAESELPQNRIRSLAREGKLDAVGTLLAVDDQLLTVVADDLLETAIESDNRALVELLAAKGLDLPNAKYASLVATAIKRGKPKVAQQLVISQAPASSSPARPDSELVLAAAAGDRDVAAALLARQPPDETERAKATPFLAAAAKDVTEAGDEYLAALLRDGFRFNNKVDAGRVVLATIGPLETSARPGRLQSVPSNAVAAGNRRVRFWIERKIGLDYVHQSARDGIPVGASLMSALVERDELELLKLLFARGGDPHQQLGPMRDQRAPILVAAKLGKIDVVRLFLEAGLEAKRVNLDFSNERLLTDQNREACRLLIEQGASFNAGFVHAAVQSKDYESLKLLLSRGFPPDGLDTILRSPINAGDLEMLTFLIDQGAELHPKGPNLPPLMIAVEKNKVAAVRLLLQRGADPNRPTSKIPGAGTPLQYAKELMRQEIVELMEDYKPAE